MRFTRGRVERRPWRACTRSLTNKGVDFQRRSRIPLPWNRPAGGVGGCVRNIGRGEPRSPVGFSLQCDARPNAGRTDAALAPRVKLNESSHERKLEIGKDQRSARDADPHGRSVWVDIGKIGKNRKARTWKSERKGRESRRGKQISAEKVSEKIDPGRVFLRLV